MARLSTARKGDTERFLRLDPEYFDHKYDSLEKPIKTHNMKKIGDTKIALLVTDGDHGNPEYNYGEEGVYYIKSKDLTPYGIDFGRAERVTEEYAATLGDRCSLNKSDVLLSTIGTIGISTIAKGDFPLSILSRDLAKIVVNKDNVLPEFLCLFLATDFFQLQIERQISGSVQQGLYLHALKKLSIPVMDMDFQKEIKKIVEKAIELNKRSKQLYQIGKKAIAISIEENEEKALEFLERELSKL